MGTGRYRLFLPSFICGLGIGLSVCVIVLWSYPSSPPIEVQPLPVNKHAHDLPLVDPEGSDVTLLDERMRGGAVTHSGHRVLVLYAFYDNHPSGVPTQNLRYFVEVGMTLLFSPSVVDFVFINANCEGVPIDHIIPNNDPHVYHMCGHNLGKSDFCLWSQAVSKPGFPNPWQYDVVVLINSSVRGPILPSYERRDWIEVFTSLLSDSTHAVGAYFSCQFQPHLQSFFVVVDHMGYRELEPLLRCYSNHEDAIWKGELQVAHQMFQQKINVAVTMLYYSTVDFRKLPPGAQCNLGQNPTVKFSQFHNFNLHPLDVVFVKNAGGVAAFLSEDHIQSIEIYSELARRAHSRKKIQHDFRNP